MGFVSLGRIYYDTSTYVIQIFENSTCGLSTQSACKYILYAGDIIETAIPIYRVDNSGVVLNWPCDPVVVTLDGAQPSWVTIVGTSTYPKLRIEVPYDTTAVGDYSF